MDEGSAWEIDLMVDAPNSMDNAGTKKIQFQEGAEPPTAAPVTPSPKRLLPLTTQNNVVNPPPKKQKTPSAPSKDAPGALGVRLGENQWGEMVTQ